MEASIGPIMDMTGRRPLFFRSGTAHYDDVALRILEALGCRAAGFSMNGDEGGTLSAGAVRRRLLSVRPRDIEVDRSALYAARYAAKNIVAAGILMSRTGTAS